MADTSSSGEIDGITLSGVTSVVDTQMDDSSRWIVQTAIYATLGLVSTRRHLSAHLQVLCGFLVTEWVIDSDQNILWKLITLSGKMERNLYN